MPSFAPFGRDDLRLMWHVLARWATQLSSPLPASHPVTSHLKLYFPTQVTGQILDQNLIHCAPPFLMSNRGWLIGAELNHQPGVVPVVSVFVGGTQDEVKEAAIRIALFSARSDGTIHAEGWRFEQAEPSAVGQPIPAHPYTHAQSIVGWDRDMKCLIHPPHGDGEGCDGLHKGEIEEVNVERLRAKRATLVRHPAFPLGMQTLTGLAAAAVTTLYGFDGLRRIMEGDRMLMLPDDSVKRDLVRLGANLVD